MNTKDVLMISPSASSPEISSLEDKGLVWRTMPSDAFQGKTAADYMKNTLNLSEVAVIYIDDSYGSGLAEEFANHFTSLGGEVITTQPYEERSNYDDFNFEPILELLFADKPASVYLATNGIEAPKIFTQIYTGNYFTDLYKPKMMTCDAMKMESVINNSPADIIDGMFGTIPAGTTNEEFDSNFITFTGAAITANAARNMYDAIYLLAYAILASESTDPLVFSTKLQEVSVSGDIIGVNEFASGKTKIEAGTDINYDGASGKIDFDENGDVTSGTYELWKIENGEYVTVTVIDFP